MNAYFIMGKTMVRTKTKTCLATSMYSNVVIHSVCLQDYNGINQAFTKLYLPNLLRPSIAKFTERKT